jgi:hypothetical protein
MRDFQHLLNLQGDLEIILRSASPTTHAQELTPEIHHRGLKDIARRDAAGAKTFLHYT